MDWNDVIQFWFEETSPAQWFKKNAAFDAKIRDRFLALYRKAMTGETRDWRSSPEGRLAEIIVLDQFGRNMFRSSPQAFAGDALALALAREAVRDGDDIKLAPRMRHFLYMPYMHSESAGIQEEGALLFSTLDEGIARFARQHKNIIDRFGRFPHRNAILGRTSTPEEVEFLKTQKPF